VKKSVKAKNFKGKFASSRIDITIKNPVGSRRSFSLIRDEKSLNKNDKTKTDRTQKTIDVPELDAINEDFKSGKIAIDVAKQLVLDLKKKLLEKLHGPDTYASTIYHSDNVKILNELIEKDLNHKTIKETSYNNALIDYDRIKNMLKGESIRIIPRSKLDVLINKLPYRISVKNKIICRLNLVLKKAGRDYKIFKRKKEHYEECEEISFIDEKQLKKLLNEIDFICGNRKLIKDGVILMFTVASEKASFLVYQKKIIIEAKNFIILKSNYKET
jgi:hypothetical protein